MREGAGRSNMQNNGERVLQRNFEGVQSIIVHCVRTLYKLRKESGNILFIKERPDVRIILCFTRINGKQNSSSSISDV